MKILEAAKFKIFDVLISAINFDGAYDLLANSEGQKKSEYILFPDLSVISEARSNSKLATIINHAYLAMPDGKPSEVLARLKGYKDVRTVSGYKLILELLNRSDKRHYFYGSTKENLLRIKTFLDRYDENGEKIIGYKEAPFLQLDEIETSEVVNRDLNEINKLMPDFVWVGVSSPKQDYLLYHHHHVLDQGYMLGVGGVFDYLSGEVKISPEWIKKIGLRWLYRLSMEPRRLFPKYFTIFKSLPNLLFKK